MLGQHDTDDDACTAMQGGQHPIWKLLMCTLLDSRQCWDIPEDVAAAVLAAGLLRLVASTLYATMPATAMPMPVSLRDVIGSLKTIQLASSTNMVLACPSTCSKRLKGRPSI
eukprot:GHUV01044976.1.p1 GENE.GHUV01044976.1~~GHUV01044976.1.p1  ORF type:complete len:112 (+),score=30.06 GHUV01044976.1:271-606(+)